MLSSNLKRNKYKKYIKKHNTNKTASGEDGFDKDTIKLLLEKREFQDICSSLKAT